MPTDSHKGHHEIEKTEEKSRRRTGMTKDIRGQPEIRNRSKKLEQLLGLCRGRESSSTKQAYA